jgi:hypothetical protein
VSVEAKQLVHLYLSNEQDLLNSGACGQQGWNICEHHHPWSAVLNKWSVACRPRNRACCFQKSFVISLCKPVWKHMESE